MNTCEYRHKHHDDRCADTWSCSLPAEQGSDQCIFHNSGSNPLTNSSISDFRDIIEDNGGKLEILGAEITEVNLKSQGGSDGHISKLDLTEATVQGSIRIGEGMFKNKICLNSADIGGDIYISEGKYSPEIFLNECSCENLHCNDSEFQSNVYAERMTVKNKFDASHSVFENHVDLESIRAHEIVFTDSELQTLSLEKSKSEIINFENVEAHGSCSFKHGKINSEFLSVNSTFHSKALFEDAYSDCLNFRSATFKDTSVFNKIRVKTSLNFINVEFKQAVSFEKAEFVGEVDFTEAVFHSKAFFSEAVFNKLAHFGKTTFSQLVDFSEVKFSGVVRFDRGSKFELSVSFKNTVFKQKIRFANSDINDPLFFDTKFLDVADFSGADIYSGLRFDGSTEFGSDLNLNNINIHGHLDLSDINVDGKIDMVKSIVEDGLEITNALIKEDVLMTGSDIHSVKIRDSRFDGNIYSKNITVNSNVFLIDTTIWGDFVFREGKIVDKMSVIGCEFNGHVDLQFGDFSEVLFKNSSRKSTTFHQNISISKSKLKKSLVFEGVQFNGKVELQSGTLQRNLELVDTKMKHGLDMKSSVINGDMKISQISSNDNVNVVNCELSGIFIDQKRKNGNENSKFDINFNRTSLNSGEVVLSDNTNINRISLSRAVLADVIVNECGKSFFKLAEFNKTEFKGFRFEQITEILSKKNWELYSDKIISIRTATEAESTYRKAKNGAHNRGDSKHASEFFIKEMSSRRKKNKLRFFQRSGKTVRSLFSYTTLTILSVLTGYGERQLRPFYASIILILIFGFIYTFLPTFSQDHTTSLVFSLQSFTAFVLEKPSLSVGTVVEILSGVQALVGAFMIGLLVFTLTRSIHR